MMPGMDGSDMGTQPRRRVPDHLCFASTEPNDLAGRRRASDRWPGLGSVGVKRLHNPSALASSRVMLARAVPGVHV